MLLEIISDVTKNSLKVTVIFVSLHLTGSESTYVTLSIVSENLSNICFLQVAGITKSMRNASHEDSQTLI